MKKRKLIVGEVLPVKTGFGFSMDLEILFFWTVWTLDESVNRSSVSINFLKQKYIHTQMLTRAQLPYFQYSVFTGGFVKMPKPHRKVPYPSARAGTFRKC